MQYKFFPIPRTSLGKALSSCVKSKFLKTNLLSTRHDTDAIFSTFNSKSSVFPASSHDLWNSRLIFRR